MDRYKSCFGSVGIRVNLIWIRVCEARRRHLFAFQSYDIGLAKLVREGAGNIKKILFLSLLASLINLEVILATVYAPLATSLDALIDNADIIVKGKLDIVNRKPFFGYKSDGSDYTLEELANEREFPISLFDQLSFPMVEYQVIPDEVIKGNVIEPIILRVMIPQLTNHFGKTLLSERIFMLSRNHTGNNTYGAPGFDAIMEKDSQDYYWVASPSEEQEGPDMIQPDYLSIDDTKGDVFDNLVRERASTR